jgi:GNAT superfamily N-acetyltransferase
MGFWSSPPQPTQYNIQRITHSSPLIPAILTHLRTHFGNPPHTPLFDIPIDQLFPEKTYLFVALHYHQIIGTIRYHYTGYVKNETKEIYCVDCFCVHPAWRKKGLATELLCTLREFANANDIPYCIFLKEGYSLAVPPFYTGTYVYRKTEPFFASNVTSLSIDCAYRLLDIYSQFNSLFLIRHPQSRNQQWKLYRNNLHWILACFQDTYQKKENQSIGWITGWIESPLVTDEIREEASISLSNRMYPQFHWIWMNQLWCSMESKTWRVDGCFHWYLYQWSGGGIGRSYLLGLN